MGKYPKEVRSVQQLQLNRLRDSLGSIELRYALAKIASVKLEPD